MRDMDRRARSWCVLAALPCAALLLAARPAAAEDLSMPVIDETGESALAPVEPVASPLAPAAQAAVAPPEAGWGVYEDWTGRTVRPDRWFFLTDRALEARREVLGHHLLMRFRLEVPTSRGNTGFTAAAQRALASNAAMDRVSADFQIDSYVVVGCETNTGTRVRPAMVDLFTFNDGSSRGPADATGDHFVRVNVNREAFSTDPAGMFTVGAFIYRCIDAACSNAFSTIYALDMGRVFVGEPFTLRAEWDKVNHRFVVGLNDGPDVYLAYSVPDDLPARTAYLRIMQQNVNANCAAHTSVTDSLIKLREIRTNPAAVVP